ncbi:hypothetical protein QMZ92_31035 [Streptomyces sp. HNM0645]|uniref:hypothetical protein n=1 Tax=Streptomyces sp. HNM0645 TaxID=2782343 RepID=UPI0024B755C1|nr:hypothetical protein [Streptomyces sp. HNM0645]MDI9888674.1 hypothetical protein [Streptomyces sp. HNM0645]
MIGLFWIDRDGCWLGAPAGAEGTGVRLTDEGLTPVGTPAGDALSWTGMERMTVPDAPARSGFRRGLRTAIDVATSIAGFGGPDSGHRMTVSVTHTGGRSEYAVLSAAAPAYTEREVELSQRLLARFVAGELRPSVLTDWWRSAGSRPAPKPPEREAVLERLLARPARP